MKRLHSVCDCPHPTCPNPRPGSAPKGTVEIVVRGAIEGAERHLELQIGGERLYLTEEDARHVVAQMAGISARLWDGEELPRLVDEARRAAVVRVWCETCRGRRYVPVDDDEGDVEPCFDCPTEPDEAPPPC